MSYTEKLIGLLERSYSPYSHFQVSSIAVMKDGREFCGVNVENASYGSTICAERSAILAAISNGYTKGDFKELYCMVNSKKISSSCFACRQVISELFDKDCRCFFMNNLGQQRMFTVGELCPYPFDDTDLR